MKNTGEEEEEEKQTADLNPDPLTKDYLNCGGDLQERAGLELEDEENGLGEGGGGDEKQNSPYMKVRNKVSSKITKVKENLLRELEEELEEHDRIVTDTRNVAFDLVDPETLNTFKDIILEKPEIEAGIQWRLWFHITRKFFSNIILKIVDIGTDIAAAYQHFKRNDLNYGFLTLFFVYLPGFVLSCGFTFWGLFSKRIGDPPHRKEVTLERLGKYTAALFLFPLLYPIVQIALGLLLVGLLIRRRDNVVRKFMGHDLSQFKSLEGFLESGPSFCLQTYTIMVGHKRGTNIDWNNVQEDDIERLVLLIISIIFSFASIVKTSCRVNVPDPDPRRKVKQYKKSAKYFKLTLWLCNTFIILYRIVGVSFFCVYLRRYTIILIAAAFLFNLILLLCLKASPTISLILGAISLFVPNGYLLYNFAGTIEVDFSARATKLHFLASTLVVNAIWFSGIVAVSIKTGVSGINDLVEHIIRDEKIHLNFVIGMLISLSILGLLSSLFAVVHYITGIRHLLVPPEGEEEKEKEEGEDCLEFVGEQGEGLAMAGIVNTQEELETGG